MEGNLSSAFTISVANWNDCLLFDSCHIDLGELLRKVRYVHLFYFMVV